jgi:hypothetical protein
MPEHPRLKHNQHWMLHDRHADVSERIGASLVCAADILYEADARDLLAMHAARWALSRLGPPSVTTRKVGEGSRAIAQTDISAAAALLLRMAGPLALDAIEEETRYLEPKETP